MTLAFRTLATEYVKRIGPEALTNTVHIRILHELRNIAQRELLRQYVETTMTLTQTKG